MASKPPQLAEVLDVLQEIAPLELAAAWDNVGLLLEPPRRRRAVLRRLLLTIDLSAAVVDEAVAGRCELVVAYHPPIFAPLSRLLQADARQRALLRAAASGLAVYSPHTALDAAPGGVADWLAEGVVGGDAPDVLRPCGEGEFGRFVALPRPVPLPRLLARIKRWLSVRTLRLARAGSGRASLRTIAVAAGAGGSVLRGERADLWLTGELSHHDVLAAVENGTTVVLAEHSNTERGYLRRLRRRLLAAFGSRLRVGIARTDRDPVTLV